MPTPDSTPLWRCRLSLGGLAMQGRRGVKHHCSDTWLTFLRYAPFLVLSDTALGDHSQEVVVLEPLLLKTPMCSTKQQVACYCGDDVGVDCGTPSKPQCEGMQIQQRPQANVACCSDQAERSPAKGVTDGDILGMEHVLTLLAQRVNSSTAVCVDYREHAAWAALHGQRQSIACATSGKRHFPTEVTQDQNKQSTPCATRA
jgi:hypothetical protein